MSQIFSTAGLLGMGIVVAWCFGREYADRTIVSLYANATSRGAIAMAKLTLLMLWALGVSGALGPVALLAGLATGLGSPDAETWLGLARLVALGVLTGALALPVAMFASLGRGYLAGVGGLLGLVVSAQVAVILGIGAWFPLSSPGLWALHTPGFSIGPAQLTLAPLFSLAMAVATVAWWRRAALA